MKVNDNSIPDDMNWADFCDALVNEAWLEAQSKRSSVRSGPRIDYRKDCGNTVARTGAADPEPANVK